MLERISCHGKKQCGLELMSHLWLYFLCGLMVGYLAGTLNKYFVVVHFGELELWVDEEH